MTDEHETANGQTDDGKRMEASEGADAADPGEATGSADAEDPDGDDGELRPEDVVVGVPLALGAGFWLLARVLGIPELSVAGLALETASMGTGLVVAGFLAHALDRAAVGERAVAAAVGAFAVGLGAAFVGRGGGGGGGTVRIAGVALMAAGVIGYAYLRFWADAG